MNPYDTLTQQHGRKSVMGLDITDAELDAETARQIPILRNMMRPLLTGQEFRVLDYGAGYGRLSHLLCELCPVSFVHAYDPSEELLRHATIEPGEKLIFTSRHPVPTLPFDLVFAAMVVGHPGHDIAQTAQLFASLLIPNGLVIIVDHMPSEPPPGRWWRYLPVTHYVEEFAKAGIMLAEVGKLMQLGNEITMLAGREA